MAYQLDGISQEIWERKYRYPGKNGVPEDRTIEDTWDRVAKAVAFREKKKKFWETRFREILDGFRFLPGGRILANAGTNRQAATMFNCYVMNTIPDSIDGIFDTVKESALTQKQGGGVGFDFSTLRPAGCAITGCEAESSGPLSFMQVLDSTCRTIMSAGQRRGAQMAVMRCDHPDIEAFITAKRENARLQMFNLSVAITDAFIDAVRNNRDWDLVFGGHVHKTVKAVEIWDLIMKSTYDFAEPGFLLIDRINEMNNLRYCEEIRATNPCVTADTWVHTGEGPRQVRSLIGTPFVARLNGAEYQSDAEGFFKTAVKPVVRIQTKDGFSLRLTQDHQVLCVKNRTRHILEEEWRAAGEIGPGTELILNNHRTNRTWPGLYSNAEGYLLGLLVGDGTLKSDKAVISVWKQAEAVNGFSGSDGVNGVMEEALRAAKHVPHRRDFNGWQSVSGRNEYHLVLGHVRNLALRLGLAPGNKTITEEVEATSSNFYRGFLRGLFDADGSVQGTQMKGISVRLAQSDLPILQAVQRMLLRVGIVSRIYTERRTATARQLPNGKGGTSLYLTKTQHELVISGENVAEFQQEIGFSDGDKAGKLHLLLSSFKRSLNRERFVSIVESIVPDGVEDVYDVQIPGVHAFDANGLIAHNCGEQPLPPYGACLLGSVNLTRFVKNPFTPKASIDRKGILEATRTAVRFLDNVIDLSLYPLPQQKKEAMAKRRMGIGITGLADLFLFMGLRYGSPESLKLAGSVMESITTAAYESSSELAEEKGAFPLFDRDRYPESNFVAQFPKALQTAIRKNGIRNSHLTSIAPTGTISLLAGNISSGLEPVFAFTYKRKIRNTGEHDVIEVEVADHAFQKYREFVKNPELQPKELPPYFVSTSDISPDDHLGIQAVLQKWVDSSISKTINIPRDYPFEDFKGIYMKAFEQGLKGCTTFRPSEFITGVLVEKDEKKKGKTAGTGQVALEILTPKRPSELEGTTYKIKTPLSPDALYVTINDVLQPDGKRRPYELFINTKNLQHFSWIVAMTRLVSAVFRHDRDPSFLVEELKSIYDPNGGYFSSGEYVPSLAADIGRVIEKHLIKIGIMPEKKPRKAPVAENGNDKNPVDSNLFMICPQCHEKKLLNQENCLKCWGCGYSKCS